MAANKTLLNMSVLEVACAPHVITLESMLIETVSTQAIEISASVVEKTSVANLELATATLVEYVAAMADLTTSTNSILTPIVTTSVRVEGGASPTKSGVTIQLKRGNRADLPLSASVGEPLVTLDTGELFVGTGSSLRKISDVVVSETTPEVTDQNKLWYSPTENTTRIYKDGSWQVTGAEASMDYGDF
jgi:hypothetical protein